jgi:hypothetical protein
METADFDTIIPMFLEKKENANQCPLCGGPTHETRGEWRCQRCCFVICLECGGVGAAMMLGD